MQAVAVNCVFPVVILEDRKRLVGALEQNKAVLTVLIKNRTVYILGNTVDRDKGIRYR